MPARDTYLINLRPQISSIQFENSTQEELFQNKTLRPIIKLQKNLLVSVFSHYFKKHKYIFYTLSIEKKLDYIENAVHKDMKFRNSLKGIIIGHFTLKEHQQYMENSSALNKRMMTLVKESIKSNIMLFEKEYVSE
jgi:hypothetical protein